MRRKTEPPTERPRLRPPPPPGKEKTQGRRRVYERGPEDAFGGFDNGRSFRIGGHFLWRRRRLDPAELHARIHDQLGRRGVVDAEAVEETGVALAVLTRAFRVSGELVRRQTGEILERTHAALAERNRQLEVEPFRLDEVVLDAELPALLVELRILALDVLARTRLKLAGGVLVEALDQCQFAQIDERDFLDFAEAFRDQELGDDLVTSRAWMNISLFFLNSSWRRSLSSFSVKMSMSHFVS